MSDSTTELKNQLGAAAFKSGADCVITQPQNTLMLKVGRRFGGTNPLALAKAEAALRELSSQFSQWLDEELTKLDAARAAVHAYGMTGQAGRELYVRAHDLKGLGGTYEFPIVTRMAGSLCRLIETQEGRSVVPMALVDAHIDAIRAAVRTNVKDDANPTGQALAQELERQVSVYSSAICR